MSTATQLSDWLNGTATGGPNSDGRYPLVYADGLTYMVLCPAAQALNPNEDPAQIEVFTNSATTAANEAGTSATSASASESNALAYADDAATSATAAAGSATAAAGSETNAAASATNAAASATNAATSETNAATAKTAAETARDKAQAWADNAVDLVVEPGLFSAKHWAQKAADSAATVGDVSGKMDKSANLSDLANIGTARANLIPNGVYGLITISGASSNYWEMTNASVTLNKLAHSAATTFVGNQYGYAESPQSLTVATAKTMLGISTVTDATLAAKANLASPIFTGEVKTNDRFIADTFFQSSDNAAVLASGLVAGTCYLRPDGPTSSVGQLLVNTAGVTWNANTIHHTGNFDPATKVNKAGDTMTGGLGFGATVAASTADLSRHISLHSAATGYGFNVTASRLNYISPLNTSHQFLVGDVTTLLIGAGAFQYKGQNIYHTGNFDPATKVNKAGDTMTGPLTFPNGSTLLATAAGATVTTGAGGGTFSFNAGANGAAPATFNNFAGSQVLGVYENAVNVTTSLNLQGGYSFSIYDTLARKGVEIATGYNNPTDGNAYIANRVASGFLEIYVDSGAGRLRVGSNSLKYNDSEVILAWEVSDVHSASTIVRRTSAGYVNVNYLNTTANVTVASPSHVAVQTGSDNYVRWQTLAQFRNTLNTGLITFTSPAGTGDASTAVSINGTGPTLRFQDTDHATSHWIHCNTNQFGFLANSSFAWAAYRDASNNWVCVNNITAYASDERLKTNIVDVPVSYINDVFGKIRIRQFDWDAFAIKKYNVGIEVELNQVGAIAQELQAAYPDAVVVNKAHNPIGGDPADAPDFLTIRWEKLIPVIIAKVQEQDARIKELEAIIRSIK